MPDEGETVMGAIFGPLGAKIGLGVSLLLLLALSVQTARLSASQHHSKKVEAELVETKAAYAQFVGDVKAKTAEAQRLDAEHKAAVEATQDQRTQEVSRDYQKQLDALRARYAGSVQPKTSANRLSGSSAASVPSISSPASGSDATGATCGLSRFNAEANALQLNSLQGWIREQEAIPR
jgi:hypothetical protein